MSEEKINDIKDAWKSYDTCPCCGTILRNYVEFDERSHITEMNPDFMKMFGEVSIDEEIKKMIKKQNK